MHIHNRFPAFVAVLLALASVYTSYLTASLTDKHRAAEELSQVMTEATDVSKSGNGMYGMRAEAQSSLEDARIALEETTQHKDQARRKFVAALREIDQIRLRYGIDATNTGALAVAVAAQEQEISAFLRYTRGKQFFLAAGGSDFGVALATGLMQSTLGQMTDKAIHMHAAATARDHVLTATVRAKILGRETAATQREYEKQLIAYEDASNRYRKATEDAKAADVRITEIRRITEEVQSQITALQRDLARIDAQLVAKLERELIEKGLMKPQPGERSDGRFRGTQTFRWPVVGKLSAGFREQSYLQFFGVPHQGLDIIVPQGTPVVSSADGIVYLARDGGAKGYSYVLVGHRNGYATLYGHLSVISVASGQEVAAGQVIGQSGGTPGTHGSGPMTTGAHLHFEVIQGGDHVDPVKVLR